MVGWIGTAPNPSTHASILQHPTLLLLWQRPLCLGSFSPLHFLSGVCVAYVPLTQEALCGFFLFFFWGGAGRGGLAGLKHRSGGAATTARDRSQGRAGTLPCGCALQLRPAVACLQLSSRCATKARQPCVCTCDMSQF